MDQDINLVKSRNIRRVLSTTAVRISLWYAFICILLVGLALLIIYWAGSSYIDEQLKSGLEQEFFDLIRIETNKGPGALTKAVDKRSDVDLPQAFQYLLVDPSGKKIAGNMIGWPTEDEDRVPVDGTVHTAWIDDDMQRINDGDEDLYWPVIGKRFDNGNILVVARSVKDAEIQQLFMIYALSILLVLIVVLVLTMGYLIGRTILKHIDKIIDVSGLIIKGDLNNRIPMSGKDDEFEELAARLNTMLNKIQDLVHGMREVTDNIAHDLRTPLTRMQNRLDAVLMKNSLTYQSRNEIELAIKDTEDLLRSFNTILLISRSEAGTILPEMKPVDLVNISTTALEFYEPMAEEKHQQIVINSIGPLIINGDFDLLSNAVANLLENSIKYTPEGGLIKVFLTKDDDALRLCVLDNGPGIPEHERERVLRRFVRLDQARQSPGNGLGLSLVKAVALLHGGELILSDNNPGLKSCLQFPRSKE